jgi:hypothetical protein
MPNAITTIAASRDAVCALLRIRPSGNNQFQVGFVGTGFGIVRDKYILTAYHVFDGGQPRQAADRFYAFAVPGNGPEAFHFPVTAFPFERQDLDFAVLELGPGAVPGISIGSLPIHVAPVADGARVVTYGFPAPVVSAATVDLAGNYGGGQFLLKAYANEGMVAGQYELGPSHILDFNVAWYNGESGGPILDEESGGVLAVMQSYRGIQSVHGVVPGPRAGRPLRLISADLATLGAAIL